MNNKKGEKQFMKKNKMMRLASLLLVCVLLTTSVISGTFAKYTSEKTAEDVARVAKWSFKVGDADIATTDFTFSLFNTVNEADTTATEAHISDTTGTIIAPGTGGFFDIVLTNESEVTAKYAIDFTETYTGGTRVPIEYKKGDGDWTSDIDDLDIVADNTATALAYTNGTTTIKVYWRWVYENGTGDALIANDKTDTDLGVAMPSVTVSAKITATQVD